MAFKSWKGPAAALAAAAAWLLPWALYCDDIAAPIGNALSLFSSARVERHFYAASEPDATFSVGGSPDATVRALVRGGLGVRDHTFGRYFFQLRADGNAVLLSNLGFNVNSPNGNTGVLTARDVYLAASNVWASQITGLQVNANSANFVHGATSVPQLGTTCTAPGCDLGPHQVCFLGSLEGNGGGGSMSAASVCNVYYDLAAMQYKMSVGGSFKCSAVCLF